jgi:hypothetical protein
MLRHSSGWRGGGARAARLRSRFDAPRFSPRRRARVAAGAAARRARDGLPGAS